MTVGGLLLRFAVRRPRLVVLLLVLLELAYAVEEWRLGPHWKGFVVTSVAIALACVLYLAWVGSRRRRAIRESPLPLHVKRKLRQTYPSLAAKDADLVERGFRQFFMACARSRGKFVAMPSKVVDAYWHTFLIDTRAYADWCEQTLGRFLHHVPTARLGNDAKTNDGLRRAWFFACKDEGIRPRQPSRLPLLFALDAKFGVPDGLVYSPRPRPRGGSAGGDAEISYGDDFTDASFSGDAGDLGGVDGGGGDGGGDGDGGGCGGGGD